MLRWLRPLVGRDSAQQVGAVRRAAEDALEELLVLPDGGDLGHGSIQAGPAHFIRIDDRERRLLLKRLHSTIPELHRIVECIQNCRRVPLADVAVDTDGSWSPIGERESWIVATGAETVPSADKRPSKNSCWPRAIFTGGCGLSAGIAACVCAAGSPTWRRDLVAPMGRQGESAGRFSAVRSRPHPRA